MLRAIVFNRGGCLLVVALLAFFGQRRASSIAAAVQADSTIHDPLAAQILCSTVRLQINYWAVGPDECGYMIETATGYGTVKEGRYLVTHNHFRPPFSRNPEVDAAAIYGQVQIYNAAGKKLAELPYDRVNVVLQDEETLVLDFGERDGAGFFEALQFTSAEFLDWRDLPRAAHMEVAQVDWDGREARVDWTTVLRVEVVEEVARLVLADPLMVGASGGGVFWNGYHLANNWTTATVYDQAGVVIEGHSTAALNSSQVVAFQPEVREMPLNQSLADYINPAVSRAVDGEPDLWTTSASGAVSWMSS